jgi:FKBP-type peptidyl-prolyl cis-trans isomerase
VLYQGDGETIPNDGNEVIISYVAYLPDGEVVEAFPPESPLQYVIGSGSVISGLDFTVKTMSLGEQVRAVIPSEYAYGSEGVPGRVPKNTALVYDIYLAAVL